MTSQDNLFHSYNLLQHLYEGVAKEEGVAYRWGNAHSKSELVRWSGTRGKYCGLFWVMEHSEITDVSLTNFKTCSTCYRSI